MKKQTNSRRNQKSHTTAARGNNLIVISRAKQNPLRAGTFCAAQVDAVIKASGKPVAVAQQILDRSGANPNKRKLEMFWLKKQGYATFKKAA